MNITSANCQPDCSIVWNSSSQHIMFYGWVKTVILNAIVCFECVLWIPQNFHIHVKTWHVNVRYVAKCKCIIFCSQNRSVCERLSALRDNAISDVHRSQFPSALVPQNGAARTRSCPDLRLWGIVLSANALGCSCCSRCGLVLFLWVNRKHTKWQNNNTLVWACVSVFSKAKYDTSVVYNNMTKLTLFQI